MHPQHHSHLIIALCAFAALSLRCSDEEITPTIDSGHSQDSADANQNNDPNVIRPELWEVVRDETQDPFMHLRPDDSVCLEEGYQVEMLAGETVFSVDTESCNHVTITQPLLRALNPGDRVQGRLWHFDLIAESPATAYAAIMLNEEIVWEAEIPIPSTSGLILPAWTVNTPVARDTDVFFFLSNHGQNSWSLIDLLVESP